MGDALIYELLLCKAHDCERHGANGDADADVYRRMDMAFRKYNGQKHALDKGEPPQWTNSLDDLEHETRVQTAHVMQNVISALRALKKKTYDQEDAKKLDDLTAKLNHNDFDREVLDQVIDEAWKLVRKKEQEQE